MFPKDRKTNKTLDKLVVKKFLVVTISMMSSNHRVFCSLGLLLQEMRFFQCDRPKTGRVRAKTCLTGQRDRWLPISYLQP